jgi:hypothetical protein
MISDRVGRVRGIVNILVPSLLCAACGASGGGPASTSAAAHSFITYGPTDPVCGTDIGPSAPLNQPAMFNISDEAPTPPPIVDSSLGAFLLQLTPGCEHGDQVRIVPPTAAQVIKSAPTADGLLAGIAIKAHARHFHIIGTGAVPFDQAVALACQGPGFTCPADPSILGSAKPTPKPTP